MALLTIGVMHTDVGLTDLKALIWTKLGTHLMTSLADPPAFTAIGSVTAATLEDGAVPLAEILYDTSVPTGRYLVQVPEGLPAGEYRMEIYNNPAYAIGDALFTTPFEFFWRGTEQATLLSIQDILEGDIYIDDSVTPWRYVVIKKDSGDLTTGTRLINQAMKQLDGTNITLATQVPGRYLS